MLLQRVLIPYITCFPPRTAVSSYLIYVLIRLVQFDVSSLSNSHVFVYVIAQTGVKFGINFTSCNENSNFVILAKIPKFHSYTCDHNFVITMTQQYNDTKVQNRNRKKVAKSIIIIRLSYDSMTTVHVNAPI